MRVTYTWMDDDGKPRGWRSCVDDKNEDVFEPRPGRYVIQSHQPRRFFYSRSNNSRLGLGAEIRESC